MKSYTDISQSKKLADILPLESADMWYDNNGESIAGRPEVRCGSFVGLASIFIPCWSLAALLDILNFPSLTQNKEDEWEVCVFDHDNDNYIKKTADNPVDACVAMIEKLHKLKML